jgi:hypothetical protein
VRVNHIKTPPALTAIRRGLFGTDETISNKFNDHGISNLKNAKQRTKTGTQTDDLDFLVPVGPGSHRFRVNDTGVPVRRAVK